MGCCSPTSLIKKATVCGVMAIVFVVVGFATDYWIEKSVNRDTLSNVYQQLSNTHQGMARFYHNRHRGLIKECYPSSSSNTFLENADNKVESDCFFIDFSDPKDISMSTDYKIRMNLLRSSLAMYVLGMVAGVVSLFVGIVLCCLKSRQVAFIAGVICFLGGILILISIVLFHGTEYVETNQSGGLGEMVFENQWDKQLRIATNSDLGYSYVLAWVGVVLTIFDGILYLLAARALTKTVKDHDSLSSYSSDRREFTKRDFRATHKSNVYDNLAMAMPRGGYPVPPMFFEGYPHDFQSLPNMRAMDFAHSLYYMPDSESSVVSTY